MLLVRGGGYRYAYHAADRQRLRTTVLRTVALLTECMQVMRQGQALKAEARQRLVRPSWPSWDTRDPGDGDETGTAGELGASSDPGREGDEDITLAAVVRGTGTAPVAPVAPVAFGVVIRGPWGNTGRPQLLQYSMYIQWSEADQCYIAGLPEWGPLVQTDGDSYEDAARRGSELLERLVLSQPESGPLPEPVLYAAAQPHPLL